jgi:nicotinamide-nucleotide amidase
MPYPTDAELHALAESIGARLRERHHMLVTAESCTGGWIAKTVTDIAGSSGWFDCGMAAYSYEAKQALLGVNPHTLAEHGAVSQETAIEMVSGALVHSGASVAVAVTGIAGPGGGSAEKPAGLVHFAASRRGGATLHVERRYGDIGRAEVRRRSVLEALDLMKRVAEQR